LPVSVEQVAPPATKGEERRAFVLLAVVLFPVLSVAVVGGYGFLVWMYQILTGPPTG
jgi:nitrate reductase NapE